MNKRYRLGEIEEAVSDMEELIGLEDDIVASPEGKVAGHFERRLHRHVVNLCVENFFEIIRVHWAQLIQAKGRFYGWSG